MNRSSSIFAQIVQGVAAVAHIRNAWERVEIVRLNGKTMALVNLIDRGFECFAAVESLRPLLQQFGRIPPLALPCVLKGFF